MEGWSETEGRVSSEKLQSMTEKFQELELRNRQLSEQLSEIVKLNADENAVINELKTQVRKLQQAKEALQNEVQIMKAEVRITFL